MKFLPGYTDPFMSPFSGRLRRVGQLPSLGRKDYIIIGDIEGNPIASASLIDVKLDIVELRTILDKLVALKFIIQEGNILLPNSQALDQLINGFLYNNNGVLEIVVPGSGTLFLQEGYVYVGNSEDIAVGQPTINFSNLPNLSNTKIWRGNVFGRPVESDALTNTENSLNTTIADLADLASIVNALSSTVDAISGTLDAIETGIGVIGGLAAFLLLQSQVIGLIAAVTNLSSRMTNAEHRLTTIENDVASLSSRMTSAENRLTAIEDDIELIRSDIMEIRDDIDDLNRRIDNLSATFVGDVQGSGLISGPINLELMLTLDQIKKAEDTVDLNNNKIINLVTDNVEEHDALNFKFLWDFMHNRVGVSWP